MYLLSIKLPNGIVNITHLHKCEEITNDITMLLKMATLIYTMCQEFANICD